MLSFFLYVNISTCILCDRLETLSGLSVPILFHPFDIVSKGRLLRVYLSITGVQYIVNLLSSPLPGSNW